jgi:hypothetical protein
MASWAPPLRTNGAGAPTRRKRRPISGVSRVGGYVLADRDLALLKSRLVAMENALVREESLRRTDRTSRALREAARAQVRRDLDLLSGALGRSA